MGRETSEVLTAISNESIEGEGARPPILGTLLEYSGRGGDVVGCLDVA